MCVVGVTLCRRARLVASTKAGSVQEQQQQQQEPAALSVGAAAADRSAFNQLEWAHEVSRPEPGCLLLAHPYMFRDRQRYFYQAVILLLDNGPDGSYGIILNRPTQYKVRFVAVYGMGVCWRYFIQLRRCDGDNSSCDLQHRLKRGVLA